MTPPSRPQSFGDLCANCFTKKTKGVHHICKSGTAVENLQKIVSENPKLGKAVAASVIKNTDPSPRGTFRLDQASGGQRLSLTLGTAASKEQPKKQINAEDLLEFKMKQPRVPHKTVLEFCTFMNKKLGRGTVAQDFQQDIYRQTKVLEEFFLEPFNHKFAIDKEGTLKTFPIVCIDNLSDFILHIVNVRGQNAQMHSLIYKVGLDTGQGFLKVSLSIVDPAEPVKTGASKCTGVNKLFIVAIAPVKELHQNVEFILSKIKASEASVLYTVDLKMANILCGLQSAACKHPCPWCETQDTELRLGLCDRKIRTLGSLQDHCDNFVASGGNTKDGKLFKNVTKKPLLIYSPSDRETLVLDIIPPCELHLLLGVVNHLFDELKKVWSADDAYAWAAQALAHEKPYQGGTFQGNQCKKLLERVDLLEKIVSDQSLLAVAPFVHTFRAFHKVVGACFSNILSPDFETTLTDF
jgi:hypothetical protein